MFLFLRFSYVNAERYGFVYGTINPLPRGSRVIAAVASRKQQQV